MIRKVKASFDRTPCRSGRKIARVLNISRERMQYMFKEELGIKLLKFQKVKELTDGQIKVKLERAKELFRFHESGQLLNLVFSAEKAFQIEQFVNKQNDQDHLPKRSAENLHLRLANQKSSAPRSYSNTMGSK